MLKTLKKVGISILSLLMVCSAMTFVPVSAEENLINKAANEVTVESYSSQCGGEGEPSEGGGTGQAYATVDYNEDTYWHSNWQTNNGEQHTITYNLGKEYTVTSVKFLPRKGGRNGDIHKMEVYVGNNADYTQNVLTGEYVFATSGPLTEGQWYTANVAENGAFVGEYVTIRVTGSYGDSGNDKFASMGEIRFYGTEYVEPEIVDKAALVQAIADAQEALAAEDTYTVESFAAFKAAYDAAVALNENADATQANVNNAVISLTNTKAALTVKPRELTDLINKAANDVTVESYSSQCGGEGEPSEGAGGGQASATVDYNEDTYWHSNWLTSDGEQHTITYNLGKEYTLKDVTFLPRKDGRNGDIHKFEVYVGNNTDYTQNTLTGEYVFATSGPLNQGQWYRADVLANGEFAGQYVTIRVTGSYGASGNDLYASMSEIRFYGTEVEEPQLDISELELVVLEAEDNYGTSNPLGQYTVASFAAYEAAYTAALAVISKADNNEELTQEEIDDAKTALETAMAGLVSLEVLKENLADAKDTGEANDEWIVGYNKFMAPYFAATEAVLAKEDATQAEVDAADEELATAVGEAIDFADTYEEVLAAIVEAESVNTEGKTEESVAALEAAIQAAQAVIDSDSTDINVLAAQIDALVAAVDGLEDAPVSLYDKTALKAAIDAADAIFAALGEADLYDVYTEDSAKAFEIAYEEAKLTYEDEGTDYEEDYDFQAAIDVATESLEDAIDGLVENEVLEDVDKEALVNFIEENEELYNGNNADEAYTADSFAAFKAAFEAALAIVDADDATQAQVNDVLSVLVDAFDALVEEVKLDKTALEAKIAEAKAIQPAGYTADSFSALQVAITAAEAVCENASTQAELDAAVTTLDTAIKALVAVNKDALILAINAAEPIIALGNADGVYTEASWVAYVAAYEAAVAVRDNENATQAEVDEATTLLTEADLEVAPTVDKTALKAAMDAADAINKTEYTIDSVEALEVAYSEAATLYADEKATQEAVDEATTALEEAIEALKEIVIEEVDFEALLDAIDAAQAVDTEKYTEESVATLNAALEAALAVANNENATQAEIDNVTDTLEAAIEALEEKPAEPTVDKTALEAAIAAADALNVTTDKYTEESVDAFDVAYSEAIVIFVDEEATQEAVDEAAEALLAAIDGLKEIELEEVDKEALLAAIEEAEELVADDYTEESFAAFEAVLEAAVAVLDNVNATQTEVDAATASLEAAIEALVEKQPEPTVDKTALEAAIAAADALDVNTENYTIDSVEAFDVAYSEAIVIFTDAEATQEAVDEATAALEAAIKGLTPYDEEEIDKDALLAAIEDAEEIIANADDYTEESYVAFKAVYDAAVLVADNEEATQVEIDNATDTLEAAIEALVEKPVEPTVDKTALEAAIAAANAINKTEYTVESVEALEFVLSEAELIFADEEATQEAVDEATTALEEAIEGLVKEEFEEVDKEALLNAIDDAEEIIANADDYTEESYAAFKTAYDAAVLVAENEEATQAEVDAAVEALEAAVEVLVEKPQELTNLINKAANEVTVESYSSQCGGEGEPSEGAGGGQASATVDYNEDTYWHSNWLTSDGEQHTITYNLGKVYTLTDVTFLPRKGGRNGDIHKFEVYVGNSTDYTQNTLVGEFVFATSGTLTEGQWYRANIAEKGEFEGQYVTIRITGSYGASGNDLYASMSEIRFYGDEVEVEPTVNKDALIKAIEDATAAYNNEAGYTPATYMVFKAMYEYAVMVKDNAAATQAEVDLATASLIEKFKALVEAPKADKSALEALIAEVEALTEADYSRKSWSNLQTALTAGKDVVANAAATQEEVDAATAALQAKKDALVNVVAMREAIAAAEAKLAEADKYTDESVANLTTYYNNAVFVIGSNVGYVQSDADLHATNINNAIAALVEKQPEPTVNKDALAEVIARAEAKLAEADKYTEESVAVLEAQLANAKEVMENAAATQMDVDQAVVRLNAAINSLVEKPVEVLDTKPLEDKIAEAKEFKEDEFYAPTFEALTAAITAAEEALATVTTNAQVAEEVAKLQVAIDALIARPARVTGLDAYAVDYKTIQIDWNAVEGATYYQIYRLNTQTGKWIKFKTSETNSYTVTGVKTGVKYSYRVIANKELADGTIVAGKSSQTNSATALLQGEPVLTIKANGKTKFDLSWTKVDGATRYLVYRKSATEGWKKVLTLSGSTTTYTTSSMVPNTYTFMIKAARYDSKDRTQTNGSNTVEGTSVFTKPVVTVTKASSTSAKIAWKAVEGVKYYEVYRATSKSGTYSKIKTTTALSFTNKSLKAGKSYFYKVRAYRTYNNGKAYTSYSKVVEYKA